MGLFTKDIETLNDLFVHTLQTIYYAENQIADTLPTLIDKARSPDLQAALQSHLGETQNQIGRLEQVFAMHGEEAKQGSCPAIDGILKAGNGMIGDVADESVRDAAITHAAQLVEHYEIAQYGALIAWARELGRDDCASVLDQNLQEEKGADARLTRVADGRVNARAGATATGYATEAGNASSYADTGATGYAASGASSRTGY